MSAEDMIFQGRLVLSCEAFINLIYCQLEFFVTNFLKIMKTIRENIAAFLQTPVFLLFPHAILLGCLLCSVSSARQQAVQETKIRLFCFCLFTALCFLFHCSLRGFITSLSPFRVVAPFESTLGLCLG